MRYKDFWSNDMIQSLTELYPYESNSHIANTLGVSTTAVANKGRELRLKKDTKSRFNNNLQSVRFLFPDHSYQEIANIIGLHISTVKKIAKRYGLKRTSEEEWNIRSRIRKETIRKEYRRVIYGLPPRCPRLKVVSNPKKISLRCKLKKLGYRCERGSNIMYFDVDLHRDTKKEECGHKLGFVFLPWEGNSSVYSNI